MTFHADLVVGDAWGYRARSQDPLVQVDVVRLGVKRPPRVLVRFVAAEFEGLQDWVPPSRLKARWDEADEYLARERRWEAATALSPAGYNDPEEDAAGVIFDVLISPELASVGWNATHGIAKIHDVNALATFLGVDALELRSDPSFEEDGVLISPWPITLAIARRAAEREPHVVLRHIENEEATARREAVYGQSYGRRREQWISPEICAAVDEEHGKPGRAVLRGWCGAAAVDIRAEVSALRAEAFGIGETADSAIGELRRHGHVRDANKLDRELAALREGADPS